MPFTLQKGCILIKNMLNIVTTTRNESVGEKCILHHIRTHDVSHGGREVVQFIKLSLILSYVKFSRTDPKSLFFGRIPLISMEQAR